MGNLAVGMPNIDQTSVPARQRVASFFSTQIQEASRFVLPRRSRIATPVRVICGGLEVCDASFRIERRTFPYMAVEFVAGGRGSVRFGADDDPEREFPLSAGSLFFYGPGDPHRILTDPQDTLVKYFVDFRIGRNGDDIRALLPPRRAKVQIGDIAAISNLFDELIRWGRRDTLASEPICASILVAILHAARDMQLATGEREARAFQTFQRCRRTLERNALALRSLNALAAECDISREYLCRLFARFDRMSPHQRLLRAKMNHAASRLRQPGVLVKDVAAEMGFSDPFHFSRAFRRCFHVSPAKFRG